MDPLIVPNNVNDGGHGTATVAEQPVTVAVPRLGKDEVAGAAVAAAAAVVLLPMLLLLVQGRGRLWMNNEYHRQWCRPDLGVMTCLLFPCVSSSATFPPVQLRSVGCVRIFGKKKLPTPDVLDLYGPKPSFGIV
uniref:Uncharacterized protein n=1 Tax=Anopheles merus TaxID=30066 RepID=A0A182UUX8_ANOME